MKISGELLAIFAAIFIGISIPILSIISKDIGAVQTTTYSSLISAFFLLLLSIIIKEKIQIKKYLKKYFKESISIIISRTVIGSLLLTYGFSLTTAIHSAFMLNLEPIFVTILGYIFLKDKINSKQIFLILMMIFGAVILSTSGNIKVITQTQIGDLIIAISLLFTAYSYIPVKRIGKEINSMTITVVNNFFGGIILLIAMLSLQLNLSTINSSNIWLLLSYVISFSVIALYLYFSSLRRTKPWIVSSLLLLSSVIGSFIAYVWLNETLSIAQVFGAFIILISSYFIIKK